MAANLLAENSSESTKPAPNTPSPADSHSMDVVIFSADSVVDYTTKKYALKKESLRAKREPTSSSKRF